MIKRIVFLSSCVLSLYTQAQVPEDALRYSRLTQPSGTARSIAIGGALTALGGDISSGLVNPAGIGMFKTGEFVLSPGFTFNTNKSTYLGAADTESKSAFNFGTTGFLFATTPSNPASGWKNYTFSASIGRTANFNNRVVSSGINNISSFSEQYLEELIFNNVTDPNQAAVDYPYGPSLAINTYLVEPELDANGDATGYYSLATPQTGVMQNMETLTKGGITTVSLAGSGNLQDKLYIGGSLNFDLLRYERNRTYIESDNTSDATNNFKSFTVNDYLRTEGSGVNLKLGLIFKPVEQLRLGLAMHTPTWYDLSDQYSTTITTDLEGYAGPGTLTQSSEDLIGDLGFFEYRFANPWRFSGGIAYVIREIKDVTRQRGFISADVEFVNYGRGKFTDPGDFNSGNTYRELNDVVRSEYKNAINVRVGGELKFNTLMVRAGFGYLANPYTDPELDGMRMNISGGLGYRNKGKFVDLTYVHQIVNDGYYPYRLQDNFFQAAALGGGVGNLMLTVGFKF